MKKLLLFFLCLYLFTLLPGVGWGDVAKYQIESVNGGFPLNAGLHPWYHILSNIFTAAVPIGSVAWKANLFSAVLSLVALMAFYQTLKQLEMKETSCVFGTLLLGLSHTFWSVSVIAESYSLFALIWILAIGQMLIYFKYGQSIHLGLSLLFLGFGMGNNLIQPFALPAIVLTCLLFVPRARKINYWLWPALFGLLGLSPWLIRIAWAYFVQDMNLQQLQLEAMDSKYAEYLFWNNDLYSIIKGILEMSVLVVYQFFACLLFSFWAIKNHKSSAFFLSVLSFTLVLFCSTYLRQRAPWLMVGAYIPLCYLITLGFEEFQFKKVTAKIRTFMCLPLVNIVLYVVLPIIAVDQINQFMPIEPMANRDNRNGFLRPWKHREGSADRYIEGIEQQLKAGDILVVDFTPGKVVQYAKQIDGRLQNIETRGPSSLPDLLSAFEQNQIRADLYLGRFNLTFQAILSRYPNLQVVPASELFKVINPH